MFLVVLRSQHHDAFKDSDLVATLFYFQLLHVFSRWSHARLLIVHQNNPSICCHSLRPSGYWGTHLTEECFWPVNLDIVQKSTLKLLHRGHWTFTDSIYNSNAKLTSNRFELQGCLDTEEPIKWYLWSNINYSWWVGGHGEGPGEDQSVPSVMDSPPSPARRRAHTRPRRPLPVGRTKLL